MLIKSQVPRGNSRSRACAGDLRFMVGVLLLIKYKKSVVTFKTLSRAGAGAVRPRPSACPRITGLFPVCAEGTAPFWEGVLSGRRNPSTQAGPCCSPGVYVKGRKHLFELRSKFGAATRAPAARVCAPPALCAPAARPLSFKTTQIPSNNPFFPLVPVPPQASPQFPPPNAAAVLSPRVSVAAEREVAIFAYMVMSS